VVKQRPKIAVKSSGRQATPPSPGDEERLLQMRGLMRSMEGASAEVRAVRAVRARGRGRGRWWWWPGAGRFSAAIPVEAMSQVATDSRLATAAPREHPSRRTATAVRIRTGARWVQDPILSLPPAGRPVGPAPRML
jgi:hypothetical protein